MTEVGTGVTEAGTETECPLTPPSLQMRVGGGRSPTFSTTDPTLATNTSRWRSFPCLFNHRPHPRYKSESVGLFLFFFNHRPHPRYKSESVGLFLLQYDHTDPTLATNTSRWGRSLLLQPDPTLAGEQRRGQGKELRVGARDAGQGLRYVRVSSPR
jgi:hypothetical protein